MISTEHTLLCYLSVPLSSLFSVLFHVLGLLLQRLPELSLITHQTRYFVCQLQKGKYVLNETSINALYQQNHLLQNNCRYQKLCFYCIGICSIQVYYVVGVLVKISLPLCIQYNVKHPFSNWQPGHNSKEQRKVRIIECKQPSCAIYN